MSHFIMRHAKSMTLMFTCTFETREAAIEQAESMGLHVGLDVLVESLQSYGSAAQHHFDADNRATADLATLTTAVRAFLDEQVESGYCEGDSGFIDDLANTIGYEFDEEKTFTLTVEVTARVKRNAYLTTDSFRISVDATDDDVFEVTDQIFTDLDEL